MNARAAVLVYIAGMLSAVGLVTIGILAGAASQRRALQARAAKAERERKVVGDSLGLHLVDEP